MTSSTPFLVLMMICSKFILKITTNKAVSEWAWSGWTSKKHGVCCIAW